MSKIYLNVERDENKNRYIFYYDNRVVKWHQYLDDKVYEDPLQFKKWMESVVQDIQLKSR